MERGLEMITNYLMKLDSIEGEMTDEQYPKWFEVLSWSLGSPSVSSPGSKGGATKELYVVMPMCRPSQALLLHAANRRPLKELILVSTRPMHGTSRRTEDLRWVFRGLTVASFQAGAMSPGDPFPTQSVAFEFAEMTTHFGVRPRGTVRPQDWALIQGTAQK